MTDLHSIAPRYQTPSHAAQTVPEPTPWWATARGVAVVLAIWALVHIAISTFVEAAINVDDAIESYLVQSFKFTYVARNPPLYDWMLYGLQQVVGTGKFSFALLRYALLFACAMLVYRVARRVIGDPRLQALAVYSLSAVWVIGYHSHRILTHSNVMIVAIAGTFLTLVAITRQPSGRLYAGLGAWIAWGVVGKFGFVAFLAALLVAGLLEPGFRRALLDRRMLVTLVVAAVPIGLYSYALHVERQDVMTATAPVVGAGPRSGIMDVLGIYFGAWVGYLLPFIALVALVFLPGNRGAGAAADTPERAAPRHVLRSIIIIGTVGTLVAVLVTGNVALRDRYFHVFFLLAPVYVFAELERLGGWQRRVPLYLGVLLALAVGIASVRAVIFLWPDPRLCGRCTAAEPLARIGPTIFQQFGASPTLVADDRMAAGRLRAALRGVRVVSLVDKEYRPPLKAITGCARVTGIANTFGVPLVPAAQPNSIEMSVKWTSPWMQPHRYSDWQITPLPIDSPLCR